MKINNQLQMMTTKKHDTTHSTTSDTVRGTTCDTVRDTTCDTVRGTTCDTVRGTTCDTVRGRDAKFCVSTNPTIVPELRFPEFHDDWQVYTMETIFVMKNGYTPSKSNPKFWENGTIPWFRMEDIRQNGTILSDSIQHITPDAVKNSGLFPAYSIILATTATIGEHALIIVDSLANQQFTFLTKRKSFDNLIDMMYFYHYMFIIDEWCKSNTNAGGLLSVNMPALKKLQIPIPPIPEQRKIALCLSSLDDLIKSVGDKIELLKQHKKGLMQKLFPKTHGTICGRGHGRDAKFCVSTNPTIVPELRFPEFSGDWQVKRLGECFVMLQNNTLSRAELNDKCGDYQNVHYGDVLIKYGSILNASKEQLPYINNNNVAEKYDKSLLNDGDVIIADTAEDETVGKCTEIINVGDKKIISGLHTIPIRSIIDFAKCFIGLYFNSNIWHSQLLRIMQGTKVYSISKSQLKNLSVCFPTLSEQRKIATCLSSIDTAIEETEKKLQMLQQHKKGLMQRMFVRWV